MRKIVGICLSILFGIPGFAQVQQNIASELVTLNIQSGEERIILRENRHFEAPNWSRDGTFLLINAGGLLEKISLTGEKSGLIHEGIVSSANNDHGISFDGKTLVFSKNDKGFRLQNLHLTDGGRATEIDHICISKLLARNQS
jgi:Tol biopolymer transport system component